MQAMETPGPGQKNPQLDQGKSELDEMVGNVGSTLLLSKYQL